MIGAVREYLVDISNISNPPDLGITLPVDISVASDHDMENIGVNYVFLTAPLPTSIESKYYFFNRKAICFLINIISSAFFLIR